MEYLPKNFNSSSLLYYRVAVFGGSFDPPTLGHESVIDQLYLKFDEILLVPSLAHAFDKKLSDLSVRLELLGFFIEKLENKYADFKNKIKVLNIEPELSHLHATGHVYTYDVLEKIEAIYQSKMKEQKIAGQLELSFVIGPDLANPSIFNRFYRASDILKKWPIVVVEQTLAIRSTYVREYIAKNALTLSTENLIKNLSPLLGSRLSHEIAKKKLYFPVLNLTESLKANLETFQVKLDLAIFSIQNNQLFILMCENNINNLLELPCAFIHARQDKVLDEALNRSFLEKLGHLPNYHEQVITQGSQILEQAWCLSITYFCLSSNITLSNPNAKSKWVKINDFLNNAPQEDQKNKIMLCLERFKNKASYTSIPAYLLPTLFTLSELQKIYEIVLNYKLEKKSFRRRFLDSDLLEDTGQIRKANHRPAQLYRLKNTSHSPYYFNRMIEGSRS